MEESIGFFDLIWSIFSLFMLAAWIWVLISLVADIFRSQDLGGVAKALWIGFVIIIPWLGVLVYVIVRGDRMHENTVDTIARAEEGAATTSARSPGSRPRTSFPSWRN